MEYGVFVCNFNRISDMFWPCRGSWKSPTQERQKQKKPPRKRVAIARIRAVKSPRIQRESEAAERAIEERVRNIAAFPLAIPLLAGPGAITATVLLAGHAHGNWLSIVVLLAVIAVVAACCALAFFFAERISGLLGMTGNIVASRLLGVLLAALAVQYVVDGVRVILNG